MRISYGNDAIVRIGTAIREVIPCAAVESSRNADGSYAFRVYSEDPISLRQLRSIETIIGHDQINIVPATGRDQVNLLPATYEGPLSEVAPGDCFQRGFLSFEWTPT